MPVLEIAMTQPAAKAGRHEKTAAADAKAEQSETDFDAAYSAEGDRETETAASDAPAEDVPGRDEAKRPDDPKVSTEPEDQVLDPDAGEDEGHDTKRTELAPSDAETPAPIAVSKGRGSDTSELAFAQRLRVEQDKASQPAPTQQTKAVEAPNAQTADLAAFKTPAAAVPTTGDADEGRVLPQTAASSGAQPERTAPTAAAASDAAKGSTVAASASQVVPEHTQPPRERSKREDEARLTRVRDGSVSESQTVKTASAAQAPPPSTPAAALTQPQPAAALVPQVETSSVDLQLQPVGDLDAPSSWDPRSPAPATLTQTLARPETPGMIGRQMAEALQRFPDRTVELSLNPRELGRVKLSISAAETGITVQVLAERPETLDLMRRNIDQLAREFEALGYESINFAFNEGQSERGSGDTAEHGNGAAPTPLSGEVEVEAQAPITLVEATGVDIRV